MYQVGGAGVGAPATHTNQMLEPHVGRKARSRSWQDAADRQTLGQRILSCGLPGPLPRKTATRNALCLGRRVMARTSILAPCRLLPAGAGPFWT